ncbi:MAG: hypothetical protein E6R08_06425 [Nevskiaceae bacterium]|nr:MAG: hypothetical protein E6R08_06425 [Nevskiaceae bacterium]
MSDNTKVINERTVVVGKLPPTKAVQVQVALVNLCGEALFKAVAANSGDEDAAGAAALSALSSSLNDELLLKTMNTVLVTYTSIDGARITNLDTAFADRTEDLWPTFFFALKVNFASFFKGGLFNSLQQKMAALSQSKAPTSTGTSPAQ